MRSSLGLLALLYVSGFGSAAAQTLAPTRDVLPDAETAIRVGAILDAYFASAPRIPGSPGYRAVLEGEVWKVYEALPAGTVGGGPAVELAKHDARVLRIYVEQ